MAKHATIPMTREELSPYMQRSDWKGFQCLAWIWLSTIGVFALAIAFPSWPMYIAVGVLLAGRMQGFAAIMHEAGHYTLFASKRINEITLNWLSSPFIFMDGKAYAKFHMIHHKTAGTDQDPDLENYQNYPVTKMSFARKVIRDVTGLTGLKMIAYWVFTGKDAVSKEKRAPLTLTKSILLQCAVIGAPLWALGHIELFAVWIIAHFTVYMFIVRFRQIAEHGGVKDLYVLDPKFNTRSVPRGILGFLFFSPSEGLSYHCEHHAFMAVPTYHLKPLHEELKKRGYYDDMPLHRGYLGVFKDIFKPA